MRCFREFCIGLLFFSSLAGIADAADDSQNAAINLNLTTYIGFTAEAENFIEYSKYFEKSYRDRIFNKGSEESKPVFVVWEGKPEAFMNRDFRRFLEEREILSILQMFKITRKEYLNGASVEEYASAWLDGLERLVEYWGDLPGGYVVPFPNELSLRDALFFLKKTSVLLKGFNEKAIIAADIDQDHYERVMNMGPEFKNYYEGIYLSGEAGESFERIPGEAAEDFLVLADFIFETKTEFYKKFLHANERRSNVLLERFTESIEEEGLTERIDFLDRLNRFFSPQIVPQEPPEERFYFLDEKGNRLKHVRFETFFDLKKLNYLAVYYDESGSYSTVPRCLIDTSDVEAPVIYDLANDITMTDLFFHRDDKLNAAFIRNVPVSRTPLILRYDPYSAVSEEKVAFTVEVAGEKRVTAEEIITRYQAVETLQEASLEHYFCDGTVSLYLKIPALEMSYELAIDGSFFYERGQGADWEQKEFYLDGVRWRGARCLDLPMLQPEKVQAVPLDITLDEHYEYSLEGEEDIDGEACWIIAFKPVSETLTRLYEGKIWISRNDYRKLKLKTVQLGLEPPVISSRQTERFKRLTTSQNKTYVLPATITGQQIFTTAGRNTVLDRKTQFHNYAINSEPFNEKRTMAYESSHRMMRDTEKGLRYLDKKKGKRVLRDDTEDSLKFLLTGVIADQAQDFPLPLLGFNYYDFNLFDTKTHMNLLFAGALLTLNLYNHSLWNNKLEVGSDVLAFAVPLTDKYFVEGEVREKETLDILPLTANINIAMPFQVDWKLKLTYEAAYSAVQKNEDTGENYRMPEDHIDHIGRATIEFDRWGFVAKAWAEVHNREPWAEWGPEDDLNDTDASFNKYGLKVTRSFLMKNFKRLKFEGAFLSGKNLDRFSAHQFGFFQNYIHGYGANTLRAESAGLLKGSFGWVFSDFLRFELFLDDAYIKEYPGDWKNCFGIGLGGGFQGPWAFLVQFDFGYGFNAPNEEGGEGNSVIQLRILKTL